MIKTSTAPDYQLENGNTLIWLCGKYAVKAAKTPLTGNKVLVMPCFKSRKGIKVMDYIQSQNNGFGCPEILVNEDSVDYHVNRLLENMQKTFKKPGSCKFSGLR